MLLQSVNTVQYNPPVFGAKLVIKNPEVKQFMHIPDDVEFTQGILDEFNKIEPEQTVEITIKHIADNIRQLIAKNLTNGMGSKSHEFKGNPQYLFYDFLEALITKHVKFDKFWQKSSQL